MKKNIQLIKEKKQREFDADNKLNAKIMKEVTGIIRRFGVETTDMRNSETLVRNL